MKYFLNLCLSSFLIFATSVISQGSPCDQVLRKDFSNLGAYVPDQLTPSRAFLEGNDLATAALNELPQYEMNRKMRQSIWRAYQTDPRFRRARPSTWTILKRISRGRKSLYDGDDQFPIYDITTGISEALNGDNVSLVERDSRGFLSPHLIEMIQRAHSSGATFLLTWENLGLRAINRLFSQRIYPVGLIDQDVKVDGRVMAPWLFPIHDLYHARFNEILVDSFTQRDGKSPRNFAKIFYEQLRYDDLFSTLSEKEKLLFDFGYFIYFHESHGSAEWGSEIANTILTEEISKERLRKFYRDHFFQHENFSFAFSDDGKVTVSLHGKYESIEYDTSFRIVQRLLNKDDMLTHLPMEIQQQIADHPDKVRAIATGFAQEFLTLFFQLHYNLATQILGIPK
jgi:hypothetical protein